MGLLARLLGASPTWGSAYDSRWWTTGSVVNLADRGVSGDAALKVATVWRSVNVLAGAIASLPLDVFRYVDPTRPELGKEVAADEPVRNLLRKRPNAAQTSYRWRHHMVGQLLLSGNYYAQKIGAPGEVPEQLYPLNAANMRIVDVGKDGSLTYEYRTRTGATERLAGEQLVHVRGFSADGLTGVSVIDLMRETTSLALSNRLQRASFVRNEMRPSVVITHPGELGDKGRDNLQKGYKRAFGGPTRAGEPLVLEEGADVKPFQITSRDAQYVESEHFLIEEFLRFIGVPGVLVGHADKTATYASAEQFFQSFVTHAVYPLATNIEEELTASLLADEAEDLFVEFNLMGLLRPDSAARAQFYKVLVELGVFTRNEVRALENRNPLEGLDEPLTPLNMGGAPLPVAPAKAPPAQAPAKESEPADDQAARMRVLLRTVVSATAARLVRKEVAALQSLAKRYAADPSGWAAQLRTFYSRHVDLLVEDLGLDRDLAEAYAKRQEIAARASVAAIEAWEATCPSWLADLVMDAVAAA
jgi:HK97 family phage portal protein